MMKRTRTDMKQTCLTVRPEGLNAYPMHIGSGAWERLYELVPEDRGGIALIADRRVEGLYKEKVLSLLPKKIPVRSFSFPEGEENKNREQKACLEDRMVEAGLGRDALVVALGGGVTSDLAGFAAATYMRGVPWIILPTTLLAMVDASIGGKTGININAGKNLVGAFHHPLGILADPLCLDTLPEYEMLNGLAEMAKAGVIKDPELFHVLGSGKPLEAQSITRSALVKIRVIEKDPQETGFRQTLNFGHTIGHALERVSGYGMNHGRAVAAGMHLESILAERLGILDPEEGANLRAGLLRANLPFEPNRVPDRVALHEAMERDKKKRAGVMRFALPEAIGRMAPGEDGNFSIPVDGKIVDEVLAEAGL